MDGLSIREGTQQAHSLLASCLGRTLILCWSTSDPTHGNVKFVDQATAIQNGLAYVQPNGMAVMKVDSTSNLSGGSPRNS